MSLSSSSDKQGYAWCTFMLLQPIFTYHLNFIEIMGWGATNVFSGCSNHAIPRYFSTTFVKNCGIGEGLSTSISAVVGGSQGHAPCRILL